MLPEFEYECRTGGKSEWRLLPARFVSPAFLARLRNGWSYGRHCCVIGPEGRAVRETGFNLDGHVLMERQPISRFRPQYWRKRWEGDVTSRPWLPPKQRVDGRVAVLNTRYSHNFYHWLIDILPRLAAVQRLGAHVDFYLVDCLHPFQQTVLEAVGIGREQLIQPHFRLLLEADELFVPSLPTPASLREFSKMLSAGLGIETRPNATRRIFITRRKTGTRNIANEDELENLLREHHFETHAMERYPLAEQAQLIREADMIVAAHGAGLANLLFARPGTRVIEIVPAGRYNATIYPEKSRIFGLHHQQLFAEKLGHKKGMQASLDDVEAALAVAERLAIRRVA
jgi:capsular polysaccharide biosynthesis protein